MPRRPLLKNPEKVLVRLEARQRAQIDRAAKALGVTRTAYIRQLIERAHPTGVTERTTCKSPTHETVLRMKGLADDAKSLAEVAQRCRAMADLVDSYRVGGLVLTTPVEDDYLFLHTDDLAAAQKFGCSEIENEE